MWLSSSFFPINNEVQVSPRPINPSLAEALLVSRPREGNADRYLPALLSISFSVYHPRGCVFSLPQISKCNPNIGAGNV